MISNYKMKNRILSIVLFYMLLHVGVNAQTLEEGVLNILINENIAKQQIHRSSREKGEDRIRFDHPIAEKLFSRYVIKRFERTFPGVEKYGHPHAKILSRYYTIEGNFKRDRLMYEILQSGRELIEDVEPLTEESTLYAPNDYTMQTHSNLEHIQAKSAWDITKGSRSIIIAVSDPSGFYRAHPDYTNSNGTNQILYASPNAPDVVYHTNYPSRDHGLGVASVAAMATDNNVGMSAIGFNSGLKVFGGVGNEAINSLVSASYDHGAHVIVRSAISSCYFVSSHQLAMDMIHDNGTVIVSAAGNGNRGGSCPSADNMDNGLVYPASYDHVISVSGVDSDDKYTKVQAGITVHDTYNAAVDITAPSWNVSLAKAKMNSSYTGVESYYYSNSGGGTSFAAPMVAGTAALMLSLHPTLTPDQVEFFLESTAVNVDGLPGNSVYAGLAGAGRLDALEAVRVVNDCFGCTEIGVYPNITWMAPQPEIVRGCEIRFQNHTFGAGDNLRLEATRLIRLLPGFSALQGSTVSAKIDSKCIAPPPSAGREKRNTVEHVTYRELMESGKIEIPQEESLEEKPPASLHIYPNPAKSDVVIEYKLTTSTHVILAIQDITGNSVSKLVNEFQETGNHKVNHDVSSLTPGVYYYQLKTIEGTKFTRFVIVR